MVTKEHGLTNFFLLIKNGATLIYKYKRKSVFLKLKNKS